MFKYCKHLQYPINIKKKDLKMAQCIIDQYGGPNGELAAAIRYLNQRFLMPDDRGKALLTDIGTEELSHVEMICTMIYQLTKDATIEEVKAAGFEKYFTEHGLDLFPTDSNGVPYSTYSINANGDPITNLYEDMAAEQKARAVYENLIDLATDPEVIKPLLFLRQREVVHFNRFKELLDYYQGIIDNNLKNQINC